MDPVAADIATLGGLLDVYKSDTGRYPTTLEGLEALRKRPAGVKNWRGPYTRRSIPMDPWGRPYRYSRSGTEVFTISSYGADGRPGGVGEDMDVSESNSNNDSALTVRGPRAAE